VGQEKVGGVPCMLKKLLIKHGLVKWSKLWVKRYSFLKLVMSQRHPKDEKSSGRNSKMNPLVIKK